MVIEWRACRMLISLYIMNQKRIKRSMNMKGAKVNRIDLRAEHGERRRQKERERDQNGEQMKKRNYLCVARCEEDGEN